MPRDWRESPVKRFQAATIAALGYPLISALGRTLRWHVEGLHHFEAIRAAGQQPVMAFWHGRILPATYFFRRRGIVVITSENFDGEWIARIIERFGYGTSRGSTSRGGQRALLRLKRLMAEGRPSAFAVDGPRGPARTVQPGVVWLAKLTGNPVVPFHMEASSYWSLNSWDRTQIPRPFSTVALSVGAPIDVAADADEGGIETKRVEVEQALHQVERRAAALLNQPPAPNP
ncbi:MAG TPA: lysophospholipid acyltransferase family protein [Vicinamibacterales bacterium]|nr:lysophospholipid acyltransferase family protein [Vicinamibacterales bacterium]